ncbi:hypothetical protein [Thermoflexus hugenholtzii]
MRQPTGVRPDRKPAMAGHGELLDEEIGDRGGSPPEEEIPAGARAWQAIREAIERVSDRPSLRARLQGWGARLRALGALAFSPPPRPAALAAAGPEGPAGEPVLVSVRSDDLRLTATLAVTRFGEVWVGFETEDPDLAGRAVRFDLRASEGERPLMEGTVRLEPAGSGRYEGRRRVGTLEGLGASGPLELHFAVVEEA